MSGGHFSYCYSQVDSMAEELLRSKDPLHQAFGKHLFLVAKAMHDVEWVYSCDYGEGDDEAAILAVLQVPRPVATAQALSERLGEDIAKAKEILRQIQEMI